MVVNKKLSGAIHCRFGMYPEDRNVQLMHVIDLIFCVIIFITPLTTSQRSLLLDISNCLYWDKHAAKLSITAYGTADMHDHMPGTMLQLGLWWDYFP